MWKTLCIVSINLTHLRPIALTLKQIKCFKRVVLDHLRIDDALLFMLHSIHTHLETTTGSVRIMLFFFIFLLLLIQLKHIF